MQCPQCTHENPADAQFCNHCGGQLRSRCPGCGRANPPQSRFCNGCGQTLIAESAPLDSPDSAGHDAPVGGPASPSAGAETILVVEDREDVRELTRDILEENGYRVIEARDPNEALSIAEHHGTPINLLLTDLVMPQMSGLDLAKRLRALRPDMRVLYMSGFVTSGALTAELVKKPFKPDALAQKVREVLDVSRPRPGDRRA